MKRLIAILIVLTMAFSLVACSGAPATSDTPSNDVADSPAVTPNTPAEEPVDAPADEPADEPVGAPIDAPAETPTESSTITLPLAEQLTFSYWMPIYMGWDTEYDGDLTKHPAFAELSARTNVYPEWHMVSSEAMSEQYGLILASNDFYDVMNRANTNQSDEVLYDNDMIYDLTDLIPVYMPDYYAFAMSNNDLRLEVTDSEGRFLTLRAMNREPALNWQGLVVRSDVLEEQGVTLSEHYTYDEMEDVLRVFKNLGFQRPFNLSPTGSFSDSNMESGLNIGSRVYADNAVVKYGPMEDAYLDYLTMMHNWYDEGLVGSDFVGDAAWASGQPREGQLTHEIGMFVINSSSIGSMLRANTDDENYYLTCLHRPEKSDGSSRVWTTTRGSGLSGSATLITTAFDEEKLPELLTYFNYNYTEEGYQLGNFGLENVHHTIDENGEYQYIPGVISSGGTSEGTFVYNIAYFYIPALYSDKEVGLGMMRDPAVVELQRRWANSGTDIGEIPSLSFSSEESEEYASKLNDCNTYVEENTVKFITGERDLSEFESFREELRRFGIETVLEIYQAAYDRYYAR